MSLRRFTSLLSGMTRVHLLRTGLELGLLEGLREPTRPAPLAERLGLDRALVHAWLRAAHAHGLIRRSHHPRDAYRIGGLARWVLDAPQAEALRALLDEAVETYASVYARLPEVMRGGARPDHDSSVEARRAAAASLLIEQRALEALGRVPGAARARRVLDIGCGYGTYLAGLLVRHRDAQGVGIERDPALAEQARLVLRDADVSRRGEIRVGDFLTLDIPRGTFELALLNNNLHYFPPEQHEALFAKARRRLAPGGVLAIQTPAVVDDWRARAAGLTTALTAFDLFARAHGNLYGLPDLAVLHDGLVKAGFEAVGETPILPGGAARYVWARAPESPGDPPSDSPSDSQ